MSENKERLIKPCPYPHQPPRLSDYEQTCRSFSWDRAATLLSAPPGKGVNMGFEAVDCHAHGDGADTIAFRFLRKNGTVQDMTYAELSTASSRFANLLKELGVHAGDRVFTLLGRIPELYITA